MQSSVAQERRKQTLTLTQERLREVLKYFPRTGRFRWRVPGPRGAPAGREAGTRQGGYRSIRIDGVRHYEHRLAWLYVHGEHPTGDIDHDNGNPSDNRISNLRHCPPRREPLEGDQAQCTLAGRRVPVRGQMVPTFSAYTTTRKEAVAAYRCAVRLLRGESMRAKRRPPDRAA
jgi:hypothetical protein